MRIQNQERTARNNKKSEHILELVKGVQEASSKSEEDLLFSDLYIEILPLMKNIANQILLSENLIDDCTNEAMMKLYTNIHKVYPDAQFFGYVKQIVRNCAIDIVRKEDKHSQVMSYDNNTTSDDEGFGALDIIQEKRVSYNPESNYEQKEHLMLVHTWISELPDVQKEALMYQILYNMSEKQIAEKTGCNINTVKSRLKQGKTKLLKRKEEYERSTGDYLYFS